MGIAWTAGTFLPLRGCCRSKRSLPRLLGIHFGLDCITYNHQRWYFHHTELQNWSMENDNRYRVFNVTAVQWEIADRNSWLPTSHDSYPNIPNIPNSLTKVVSTEVSSALPVPHLDRWRIFRRFFCRRRVRFFFHFQRNLERAWNQSIAMLIVLQLTSCNSAHDLSQLGWEWLVRS